MDQSTKDLLTILIPTVGTVLTALIPVIADLIKARWQAAKPDDQASRRTPEFYRGPVLISGLVGLSLSLIAVFILRNILALPTSTPSPTPSPTPPPEITIEWLGIGFSSDGDLPPDSPIPVKWRVRTIGTTGFVVGYDRYLWVIVCQRVTVDDGRCIIQQLFPDAAGEWDDFVVIGNPADDCAKFEVGFAIVDRETNLRLKDNEPEIRYNRLPRDRFLEIEWRVTIRAVDEDDNAIPTCWSA
jgi:hypothetical protein